MKLKLKCKNLRKLEDVSEKGILRYVGYVNAASFLKYRKELEEEWMLLNPRFQKITTKVSKKIENELLSNSSMFHIKNKGILFSAKELIWDSKTEELEIEFTDQEIHGNIDGGHTLKIILNNFNNIELLKNQWVFVEILVNINTRVDAIDISVARNSAISVDLKSQEEMVGTFEPIKKILNKNILEKVYFKMNEEHVFKEIKNIDIRVIIAIFNIFYLDFYPNNLGSNNPIQSYSGKEASLEKYVNLSKKEMEDYSNKLSIISNDIFKIYDLIETDFGDWVNEHSSFKYSSFEYSKELDFKNGKIKEESLFFRNKLKNKVPTGIIYPILSSMRALITEKNGVYEWIKDPFEVLKSNNKFIVQTIMDNNEKNPDYIGKSNTIWSNLFNLCLIKTFVS